MKKIIKKLKMPEGGVVKDSSVVNTYVPNPMTDSQVYLELAKRGMVGHGADSLTAQQWAGMTGQQRLPYIGKNQGIDYTLGNTANRPIAPGGPGIKWWSLDPIDGAKAPKGRNVSDYYFKEKKNTKYDSTEYGIHYPGGGIAGLNPNQMMGVSGLTGLLGAGINSIDTADGKPSVGGQIASGAASGAAAGMMLGPIGAGIGALVGGAFGGIKTAIGNKKMEDAQALQEQAQGEASQAGIQQKYTGPWATGGITPNGMPIEVERGEVLRNPNDGSLAKISDSANTHAQGGVNIGAEGGTEIYGNRRVKSGRFKGLMYKEAADKIRKEIARLEKN